MTIKGVIEDLIFFILKNNSKNISRTFSGVVGSVRSAYFQRVPWSGLYFSSSIGPFLCAAAAAKSLQSCPTVRPHRQQPTRLPHPWDSPGKNTGVGCHFLLQCTKVKSQSEVTQSCPTLSNPMDCSLPGFSIHGIFQARVLEWGAIAFSTLSM